MTAMTIIIPAYNEAGRLPACLSSIFGYLGTRKDRLCDVIVVDDGSDDDTARVVERLAEGWPRLSLIRNPRNLGKGEALRVGIMAAGGEVLLLVDADGATPIEEEARLLAAIDGGAGLAIGSRSAPDRDASRRRAPLRALAGGLFSRLVRLATVGDTQCGFKMIRRGVGRRLVPLCRERGYLLDIELLIHAYRSGDRVAEVPVSWAEVPGSKVHLVRDGWRMIRGLWSMRALARQANMAAAPASGCPLAPLAARFE
jgi:dolichyl-phosphate beta-glucosyltransferase